MNEIERLIARDRAAGTPGPPDVRYTVARLERRLGRRREADPPTEWFPAIAAGSVALALPAVGWLLGLSPWWLVSLPLSLLAVAPVLLRKGAK